VVYADASVLVEQRRVDVFPAVRIAFAGGNYLRIDAADAMLLAGLCVSVLACAGLSPRSLGEAAVWPIYLARENELLADA